MNAHHASRFEAPLLPAGMLVLSGVAAVRVGTALPDGGNVAGGNGRGQALAHAKPR